MSTSERAAAAYAKVQLGEITRARQCLTGAALAPGTEATYRQLQDKRPQEPSRALSDAVLGFAPREPVVLNRSLFMDSLRTAPRGSSPGPGGCTYEHLKPALDDDGLFDLLLEAANSIAQANAPEEVLTALMSARLTALSKKDGGVRGIASGCSLRRLVARTLAKQFGAEFEARCSPFQCALSTRAGTDCVGHMLRAATDASPTATVLGVDGFVLRDTMLSRLAQMPMASAILLFVRLSYAQPSTYSWYDDEGHHRTVVQAEGGE